MKLMTAPSALALFETTKDQRRTFIANIITEAKEGNIDVLKLHMQAKCSEQLMKELLSNDDYKSLVMEQAGKYGKKFEMYNSEFQIKEAGTKWDYSKCEDTTYQELLEQQAEINDKVKAREKLLQTIPASGVVDPDTGAMIYPASKSSTTIVQCVPK